jgi:hypothetical protein
MYNTIIQDALIYYNMIKEIASFSGIFGEVSFCYPDIRASKKY